jgi:hypothetical protein
MNLESLINYEPEIMLGLFLIAVGYTSLKVWFKLHTKYTEEELDYLSKKYDDL